MKQKTFSHSRTRYATSITRNLYHRNLPTNSPEEVPPDVLRGFAGFAGVLRQHYPERIPAYCERVSAMLDELPRLGKAHETPRFARFLALLSEGAEGAR